MWYEFASSISDQLLTRAYFDQYNFQLLSYLEIYCLLDIFNNAVKQVLICQGTVLVCDILSIGIQCFILLTAHGL